MSIINFKNKYYIAPPQPALLDKGYKLVDYNGCKFHLLPFNTASYKLLMAIGHTDIEQPLTTRIWEGASYYKPYGHQMATTEFLVANPKAFCWNEAGTGKTASCVWAILALMKQSAVTRTLIVCPLSTVRAVWQMELFRMCPEVRVVSLIGAKSRRKKLLESKPSVCCINHDGVKVVLQDLLSWKPDLIIADESTAFKNVRTSRWKAFNQLVKQAKYLWLLSGTPAPQAPTDLYGQGRLVCPELVGRSFVAFRDATMTCVDPFGYKWLPRPNVEKILQKLIRPVIRYKRQDCLELPDLIKQTYEVDFSKKQQQTFDRLRKDALVQIDTKVITAANEGVMRSKLLQCCGGYVYGLDEGEPQKPVIDLLPVERVNAVRDIIEESGAGILIFIPFKHAIHNLNLALYKQYQIAVITGEVGVSARTKIFHDFQEGRLKIIIAHPRTMGHGVTLTNADTIIWYIVSSDNELYEQANSRINRIGQDKKMRVIHLVTTALEKNVLQRLESRQSMQGVLLETLGRGKNEND